MWKNEGIKSYYRGFIPSLFLSVYGVIQMFCYENINYIGKIINKVNDF